MVNFYYSLQCFAIQSITIILFVFGGGILIALANKLFYKSVSIPWMQYATGIIGTPIHELSHAFFCVLFGHKIIAIKLFQIDETSGCLGFVNHQYNKRNIYQVIGNFFIGIAPIIGGSCVIILLFWLLVPEVFADIVTTNTVLLSGQGLADYFKCIETDLAAFFSEMSSPLWWLFVFISGFISLHMTLSKADIKSSWLGGIIFLLVLLIVNIIISCANLKYAVIFHIGFENILIFLIISLIISAIVSIFWTSFAWSIKGIVALIKNLKTKIGSRK